MVDGVGDKGSQHKVALLLTPLALDEKSTRSQHSIEVNLLTVPVVSLVSIELVLDLIGKTIQF